MIVFLIVLLVLVVGAVVAVVVGRVGTDTMSEPGTTSGFELPDGRLGALGPDAVRLDQSFRGYNMAQVDAVLDRLFDEIGALEDEIAHRRGGPASAATVVPARRRTAAFDTAADPDDVEDLEMQAGRRGPERLAKHDDAHRADDGEIVPLRRGGTTETE